MFPIIFPVIHEISIGLIPGDVAFWSCGFLVAIFFWALARFLRRRFWREEETGPPPDLCCPMSLELFTDPVVAADGETYEFLGLRHSNFLLTVCFLSAFASSIIQ